MNEHESLIKRYDDYEHDIRDLSGKGVSLPELQELVANQYLQDLEASGDLKSPALASYREEYANGMPAYELTEKMIRESQGITDTMMGQEKARLSPVPFKKALRDLQVQQAQREGMLADDGQITRGLSTGGYNVAKGFADFASGAAEYMGFDAGENLADDVSQWAEEGAARNSNRMQFKDMNGIGDFGKWALHSMSSGAVDLASFALPGGVAKVAGKAFGLVKSAKGASGLSTAVNRAFSTARMTGEGYGSIKDETGESAQGTAIAYGVAAGYLERIFPEGLVSDRAKESLMKSFTKGLMKGFATEGSTEMTQEFLQDVAIKSVDENYQILTEENLLKYVESGVAGGLIGGAVGGAGGAVNTGVDPEEKKKQEDLNSLLQGQNQPTEQTNATTQDGAQPEPEVKGGRSSFNYDVDDAGLEDARYDWRKILDPTHFPNLVNNASREQLQDALDGKFGRLNDEQKASISSQLDVIPVDAEVIPEEPQVRPRAALDQVPEPAQNRGNRLESPDQPLALPRRTEGGNNQGPSGETIIQQGANEGLLPQGKGDNAYQPPRTTKEADLKKQRKERLDQESKDNVKANLDGVKSRVKQWSAAISKARKSKGEASSRAEINAFVSDIEKQVNSGDPMGAMDRLAEMPKPANTAQAKQLNDLGKMAWSTAKAITQPSGAVATQENYLGDIESKQRELGEIESSRSELEGRTDFDSIKDEVELDQRQRKVMDRPMVKAKYEAMSTPELGKEIKKRKLPAQSTRAKAINALADFDMAMSGEGKSASVNASNLPDVESVIPEESNEKPATKPETKQEAKANNTSSTQTSPQVEKTDTEDRTEVVDDSQPDDLPKKVEKFAEENDVDVEEKPVEETKAEENKRLKKSMRDYDYVLTADFFNENRKTDGDFIKFIKDFSKVTPEFSQFPVLEIEGRTAIFKDSYVFKKPLPQALIEELGSSAYTKVFIDLNTFNDLKLVKSEDGYHYHKPSGLIGKPPKFGKPDKAGVFPKSASAIYEGNRWSGNDSFFYRGPLPEGGNADYDRLPNMESAMNQRGEVVEYESVVQTKNPEYTMKNVKKKGSGGVVIDTKEKVLKGHKKGHKVKLVSGDLVQYMDKPTWTFFMQNWPNANFELQPEKNRPIIYRDSDGEPVAFISPDLGKDLVIDVDSNNGGPAKKQRASKAKLIESKKKKAESGIKKFPAPDKDADFIGQPKQERSKAEEKPDTQPEKEKLSSESVDSKGDSNQKKDNSKSQDKTEEIESKFKVGDKVQTFTTNGDPDGIGEIESVRYGIEGVVVYEVNGDDFSGTRTFSDDTLSSIQDVELPPDNWNNADRTDLPEEGRNKIVIRRQGYPPFVVNRGDHVLNMRTNTIEKVKSISLANREINREPQGWFFTTDKDRFLSELKQASEVNRVGYEIKYPENITKSMDVLEDERLAEEESKKVPLSEVIIDSNKKTMADFDLSDKIITLDELKDVSERVDNGDISATELKEYIKAAVSSKDFIKSDLNKLTKAKLSRYVAYPSGMNKPEMVNSAYRSFLMSIYPSETFSYGMSGVEPSILSKSENLTDEEIKTYSEKVKSRKEEYKDMVEEINNPTTLKGFRDRVRFGGLSSLSKDQRRVYDSLVTDDLIKQRRQNQVKKSELRGDVDGIVWLDKGTGISRDGEEMTVLNTEDRLGKDVFKDMANRARQLGGFYKMRVGFHVPKGKVQEFKGEIEDNKSEERAVEKIQSKQEKSIEKLEQMIEKINQRADDEINSDRKVNTAKRAREAASAIAGAEGDKRKAQTLQNIIEGIKSGDVKYLNDLSAFTQFEELEVLAKQAMYRANRELDPSDRKKKEDETGNTPTFEDMDYAEMPTAKASVYAVKEVVKEFSNTPGLKAITKKMSKWVDGESPDNLIVMSPERISVLKELHKKGSRLKTKSYALDRLSDDVRKANRLEKIGVIGNQSLRATLREFVGYYADAPKKDPIKAKELDLVGRKIDGYFPTPAQSVSEMVDLADIQPNDLVLEPNGGKGNIADRIKEVAPDAQLDVIEIYSDLVEILEMKGHNVVDRDFTEYEPIKKYNKILMNPPFEKGQDIEHVMRAFDMLEIGGRLVAITSEGPFFRQDKKSESFRDFVDKHGYSDQMEEGTFLQSDRSTGVRTRMVVLEKKEDNTRSSKRQGPAPKDSGNESAIRSEVNDLMKQLKGLDSARIKFSNKGEKGTRGMANPDLNEIVLFTNNINADMVKDLLIHEDFVHLALKGIIGEQAYNNLRDRALKEPAFQKLIKEIKKEYGDISRDELGDEVLAHWYEVQWKKDIKTGTFKHLIQKIKRWLKAKFGADTNLENIEGIMAEAFRKYRNGHGPSGPQGGGKRSSKNDAEKNNVLRDSSVPVSDLAFKMANIEKRDVYADYEYLSRKHPELFDSSKDAKIHVENVLIHPDFFLKGTGKNNGVFARKTEQNRNVVLRITPDPVGKYHVRSAHSWSESQYERFKKKSQSEGYISSDSSDLSNKAQLPSEQTGNSERIINEVDGKTSDSDIRYSKSTDDSVRQAVEDVVYGKDRKLPNWIRKMMPSLGKQEAKDMNAGIRHTTTLSFKAKKYGGALKDLMKIAMNRVNKRIDISSELRDMISSYSDLKKDDRKAVDDLLHLGDRENKEFAGSTHPEYMALNEQQREAYDGVRAMFDKVKGSLIEDISSDIDLIMSNLPDELKNVDITELVNERKPYLSEEVKRQKSLLAKLKSDLNLEMGHQYWTDGRKNYSKVRSIKDKIATAEKNLEQARVNERTLQGVVEELRDKQTHRQKLAKQKGYFPRIRAKGQHLSYWDEKRNTFVREVFEDNQSDKGDVALQARLKELEELGIVPMDNLRGEFARLHQSKIMGKLGKGGFDSVDDHYDHLKKEIRKKGFKQDRVIDRPEELFRQGASDSALTMMSSAMQEGGMKGKALEVANESIRTMFYSRGWRKHLLTRQGELIEGYQKEDLHEVLNQFIGGFSGITSKAEAAKGYYQIAQVIDPDKTPQIYANAVEIIREELRNSDVTDKVSGFLNGIVYHTYMGFRASTALINSTQNFLLGVPALGSLMRASKNEKFQKEAKEAGFEVKAAGSFAKAMKDAGLYMIHKKRGGKIPTSMTVEEVAFLNLEYDRIVKQNLTQEMTEKLADESTKTGKVLKALDTASSAMFSTTEQLNRLSTLLVYKRYMGKDAKTETDIEQLREGAELFVQDVHFSYEKWNQLDVFKNPVMRLAKPLVFALASYNQNLFQSLALMDRRSKVGFAVALTMMAGIPLEDIWEEYILMQFFDTHSHKLLGDSKARDFVTSGLPGVAGIDISGSLSMNPPPILDMFFDLSGFTELNQGPFQGIVGNTAKMLDEGFSYESFQKYFPVLAVRSALQGYGEYETGLTTRSGKPIVMDGDPIKRSAVSALLKGLGIREQSIGAVKTRGFRDKQLTSQWQSDKKAIVSRWVKATTEERNALRKEIKAFNKRIQAMRKELGRSFRVAPITGSTIASAKREIQMHSYPKATT